MPVYGVQTYAVPAGSGAILEFYIPEEGVFPFLDHDKLAYLPSGLALAFATSDTAKTTSQCAVHTHQASVDRTDGSRQGCTVDKITALAAAARTNARVENPKPYSPIRERIKASPAAL